MLDAKAVKQIAHEGELTQTTRLLLCLAVGDQPKAVADIVKIGKQAGIAGIQKWNISSLLSASKGKAIRTTDGWELTAAGKAEIEPLAGPLLAPAPLRAAVSLRSHLASLKNPDTRAFVEQAISCLEHKLFRAAVVLSWVGAVAVLYDHVITNELATFNAQAPKHVQKWKVAKTADDLALMPEHDFLQVLHAISVVGKSVKQELEARLKLRNGCGHPNSLALSENMVSAHIEALTLNVFAKF